MKIFTTVILVSFLALSIHAFRLPQFLDDPPCVDKYPEECEGFAAVGHCDEPRFKRKAHAYCPKSCLFCIGPGGPPTKAPRPHPADHPCVKSTFGCCGDMKTVATGPNGQGCTKGCSDAQEALRLHNELRGVHGALPLYWNSELFDEAQRWAEYEVSLGKKLANHIKLFGCHEALDGSRSGENLAMLWKGDAAEPASFSTSIWYDEIKDYDFTHPGFSGSTGHFTQVVWKESAEVGFGCAESPDGEWVHVVARYGPKGNFGGSKAFEQNVEPPLHP